MVDINLIGDDKTGEEERVEEFTQTSSMDTQELAFEERTETFDTTKTAGFAQKRSYSSLIATLIIMAVIVLLGGAVYFFMFSGDNADQPDIPAFAPESQDVIEPVPVEEDELAQFEREFADQLANEDEPASTEQPDIPVQPVSPSPQPQLPAASAPPPQKPERSTVDPVAARFVISSREAIQSVTNLLSSVPSDLSTTLLSYTGQRVRIEFVARTASSVTNFTNRLNQVWGTGSFAVVSQSQVDANGGFLEKVLVSGRVTNPASTSANGSVRFLNLAQARDWLNKTAQQYGISVRELRTQSGTFVGGYQKIPMLARVLGSQSAIVGFLQEISNQSVNMELIKILLVSPDMVNFSDDNLILVLNMILYEQS